jgi:hypothetical protein
MAYTTSNALTTTASTIFDKDTDGTGPLEWEFIASGDDVNLFFTGVWPEASTAVVVSDGETYRYGSMSRGFDKIEAAAVNTTATLTARPRFA